MSSNMTKFLLTEITSPWRWARRKYWIWRFNKLTVTEKYLVEFLRIDPESLIERGEL